MTVKTVQFNKGQVLNVYTSADLTQKRHHCVSLVDNLVAVTPEGQRPWGILQNAPLGPKQSAGVIMHGLSKGRLGAAAAQFEALGPDAEGKLVPDVDGIIVAQEAGEAGDLIDVFIGDTTAGSGSGITDQSEWFYELLLDVPAGQQIPIAAFQGRAGTEGEPPLGTVAYMAAQIGLQIWAAGTLVAMAETGSASLHAASSSAGIAFGQDLIAGDLVVLRVTE